MCRRDRVGARVLGQQLEQVAAQHRGARGLDADDRDAVDGERAQHLEQVAQVLLGAVELAGRDPRDAATRVARRDQHAQARVLEHAHDRLGNLGAQAVGERVGPQHHGVAADVVRRVGSMRADRAPRALLGEPLLANAVRWNGLGANLGSPRLGSRPAIGKTSLRTTPRPITPLTSHGTQPMNFIHSGSHPIE